MGSVRLSDREIWLFDIDGTLVDSFDAEHLRPLVIELFTAVRARGARIFAWSAGGAAHAQRVVDRHGLSADVDGCHDKIVGVDGRWDVQHILGGNAISITCVDDQLDRLPRVAHSIGVFPYLRPNPHDRGLAGALASALGARR
jgi:hypothetical protein